MNKLINVAERSSQGNNYCCIRILFIKFVIVHALHIDCLLEKNIIN